MPGPSGRPVAPFHQTSRGRRISRLIVLLRQLLISIVNHGELFLGLKNTGKVENLCLMVVCGTGLKKKA